jgi:amidohydrolase
METVTELLQSQSDAIDDYVVEKRRWFHRHPELSGEEFETTEAIARELDMLGIPWTRPIETGLVATIRGTAPGSYGLSGEPAKRLLMRADIDALPVLERTGAEFASVCDGVSHACGHDCHIAMMLGTAKLLMSVRDRLKGEIRIVFQPAEETSSGARAMIKAGVCDGVDGVYGAHIWSEIPAGKISVEAGPRMANTDWWRIDVTGKSAHGALPHRGADAILAGAAIVEELQTIVSRSVSPFEPAVVTVGEFHGGTAKNVIAGTAWLEGTVRTFDSETHARMPHLMQRVARDTARALGCDANVTQYDLGSWAVINDEHASALAAKAVEEVLGPEWIGRYRGSMPGEDFSEYLFKVPGVFAFIGCANPDKGKAWPQHSAFYSPDEDVLVAGSLLAAQYAYDFLVE